MRVRILYSRCPVDYSSCLVYCWCSVFYSRLWSYRQPCWICRQWNWCVDAELDNFEVRCNRSVLFGQHIDRCFLNYIFHSCYFDFRSSGLLACDIQQNLFRLYLLSSDYRFSIITIFQRLADYHASYHVQRTWILHWFLAYSWISSAICVSHPLIFITNS